MVSAARAMARGDYERRVTATSRDEVGELGARLQPHGGRPRRGRPCPPRSRRERLARAANADSARCARCSRTSSTASRPPTPRASRRCSGMSSASAGSSSSCSISPSWSRAPCRSSARRCGAAALLERVAARLAPDRTSARRRPAARRRAREPRSQRRRGAPAPGRRRTWSRTRSVTRRPAAERHHGRPDQRRGARLSRSPTRGPGSRARRPIGSSSASIAPTRRVRAATGQRARPGDRTLDRRAARRDDPDRGTNAPRVPDDRGAARVRSFALAAALVAAAFAAG